MYGGNIFPAVCETSPVHYAESAHLQMYRAWDGSYFAVPANNTVSNIGQLHVDPSAISSNMKINPATDKKKTRPLQNISNLPTVPSNQFVSLPPNTQIPGLHASNLFQGMTSSAGMPQFYHPGPSEFALAPSVDYPFTGLLSPYSSRPSMSVPLPSTPADIQTNTSPLTPVAENRFIDSSPVFNTPLPFETLMSNLQELLAADHHAKNAKKATEAACTQSSVGPACFSTPTEDVWQKQHDTSFNSSIHSNTPEAVPYSNNQMVPNISVTPYPIGFNMPATQYPTNWIVPNTSATESTAYPTNQVVPNILSSSSPSSSEAEYPTEQARIAAREHALKVKFSQLAKHQTMSPQVKELSDFLQTQCAQIEMYRLQQLTETSYPHHKEWLNGQCDSQLHQLMDRVEVSLQVLEKCATDNGRRHDGSRRKIPESVSRVFEAWYQANVHHPYPTAEMCLQLADTTGMKVQQVRKWFSNKRCRSKVLQRSMGKSLDEGVTIQMH